MQSGGAARLPPDASTDFTVAELCAQYLRWATEYYVKGGVSTSELDQRQAGDQGSERICLLHNRFAIGKLAT